MDAPTVRLHDVAHDREPEARGPRVRAVLREALEDPFAALGRDAGTRVGHVDPHGAVADVHLDRDPAPRRRVTQGIGDQVRDGPGDLGRVAGERDARRRTRLQRYAALARLQREQAADACHQPLELDALALERDRHGARARDVEQALCHVLEPEYVLVHGVDERP
jgi:hypothetical protein